MSYKYYESTNKIRTPNPKESYYQDYAAILDSTFDNAANVVYDEIEYEENYGMRNFKSIDRVRVDTVLEYNTGIILGDDYKTFSELNDLFKLTAFDNETNQACTIEVINDQYTSNYDVPGVYLYEVRQTNHWFDSNNKITSLKNDVIFKIV